MPCVTLALVSSTRLAPFPLTVLLLLTGCGSVVNSDTTTSSRPPIPPTSAATPSTTAVAQSTSPPTTGGTNNLIITDAVRAQLLRAGAALNNLPAADFVGLVPGDSYYAYDGLTATYWAGAKLEPGSSTKAQVSVQDDGAYVLFHRPGGGSWIAQDVGLAGVGGTRCPVVVPSAILALWNWSPGSCRPTSF